MTVMNIFWVLYTAQEIPYRRSKKTRVRFGNILAMLVFILAKALLWVVMNATSTCTSVVLTWNLPSGMNATMIL
jgi:hypothetical protein